MPQNPISSFVFGQNPAKVAKPAQVDYQQNLKVAQGHAEYYESAYGGAVGLVANSAAVTTSAALATTYVGLCLSNPAGSGKNLALVNASAALLVAPSTITTMFLAGGYSAAGVVTHTTPVTPLNAFLSQATALVGLADSACTIVGTPAYLRVIGQASTATTSFSTNIEVKGGIIIPPGGYVCFATNIAGPASGFVGSFLWEEYPQ